MTYLLASAFTAVGHIAKIEILVITKPIVSWFLFLVQ